MAAFMPSAFTAADRRKKMVTYGKSSRLPPKPPVFPRDEAPSPDRPRKQTSISSAQPLQDGVGLRAIAPSSASRAESPDVFDMPSEDDMLSRPARTTKKLPMKRKLTTEPPAKQSHPEEAAKLSGQQIKKKTQTIPQLVPARVPATLKVTQPTKQRSDLSVRDTVAATSHSGQSTHAYRNPTNTAAKKVGVIDGTRPNPKGNSQTTAAQASLLKPHRKGKPNLEGLPKAMPASRANRQPAHLDVFDLPSSEDEASVPTPKLLSRSRIVAPRKESTKVAKVKKGNSTADTAESDESNASYKRKRVITAVSNANTKSFNESEEDASFPQRSRKYQKKEESQPSPQKMQPSRSSRVIEKTPQPEAPPTSKPKRTRIRTVPVLNRTQVSKGQSSPAVLNSMLPEKTSIFPTEPPQETGMEDESMYDIPEPVQSSPYTHASGSVTPRQKALFGSLLGAGLSPSTPMPNISQLQLTTKKPNSLLGALSRSKSDLTPIASSRQTKLIGRLKQVDGQSKEDASGSDSEQASDEEDENSMTAKNYVTSSADQRRQPNETSETITMDMVHGDSQTSQATSDFTGRPKFTYAKSRSYLQEANPEDAFLMAMDLDENIAFGSQKQSSRNEESEEDEASQVRAIHELKRQGQQDTFEWEMLIEDMSAKSSASVRRSAILEFCTKMADDAFTSELLDSTLSQRFLRNISTPGEIIFDIVAVTATIFMLRTKPTYTMVEQIHESVSIQSMMKLLDNGRDIRHIAKDRKTNLSRISQESVMTFRTLIQGNPVWDPRSLVIVSPQILVLKAIELYLLGARKSGSIEEHIEHSTIAKIVGLASDSSDNLKTGKDTIHSEILLNLAFSVIEAVSLTSQQQQIWPSQVLRSLSQSMSVSFDLDNGPLVMLAAKLCMNLTNNKPKACRQFSEPSFVQSCGRAVIRRFEKLHAGVAEPRRTEVLDSLILSLGTMINLTEHSDSARIHMDDGKELLGTLAKVFLDGSARAAQADSMEESQSSVAIGYLSVLLGNICLNNRSRTKIQDYLPNHDISILIEKIKEFINVHEHLNRTTKQYEGDEGQQTWQEYTSRLMQVVKRLERPA